MIFSMPCLNKPNQRGFTLVEIAIVLVVIGLLIGGVLRGQELINAARVNTITTQMSSVQTAFYGFIDRYKFMPGDLTGAQAIFINNYTVPASAAADGSVGLIDSVAFFNNLASADFISCTPCTSTGTGGVINVVGNGATATAATYAAPTALTAANTIVNPYGSPMVFLYDVTNGAGSNIAASIIFLSNNAEAPKPQVTTGGTLSSAMLAEIDRKIDDGNPATAQFRYTDLQGTAGLAAGAPVAANFANAANSNACWNAAGWITVPPSTTCQGASIF